MKRSPHLTPLSRDHQHGLAFAKKLRDGLRQDAEAEQLCADAVALWKEELQRHFELEEEHLLAPLVQLEAAQQKGQLQREHRQIESLVDRLREPQPDARTTLSELADAIIQHIRFEERELFPFLEKHLDDDELERIGEQLHTDQEEADDPR